MPRIKIGSTPSVVVVQSSNLQEDRETLKAIFPDRFRVEKPIISGGSYGTNDDASTSLLIEEHLTLILVSCPPVMASSATLATVLVLEEEVIRQAAERAVLYGVPTEERILSETNIVKLRLPGGASLLATTADVWSNKAARSTAIACLMAPPALVTTRKVSMNTKMRQEIHFDEASLLTNATEITKEPSSKRFSQRDTLMATSNPTKSKNIQRSTSMPELGPAMTTGQESFRNKSVNRIFPSLRVKVLEFNGRLEPFPLNTQVPVPVETELFVGNLLLIMRPENPAKDDPYWNDRIFSRKKRRVVMQLQGKLKYKPQGVLYAGMEISDPMRLGLIASGLCNLLLKMSSKFNPHIHFSFGDNEERPHICFPASTFFERLLVTKPGEKLPPIDEEFVEDPTALQDRKSYKTKIDWNTEDTYSVSFHSMYIDFPTWSVVRLPIGKDISLQTFWGDSSASVVFYEVDNSSSESTKKKKDSQERHLMETNKYILSVEMKRMAKNDVDEASSSEDPSTSDGDWSEEKFVEIDVGSVSTNGDSTQPPVLPSYSEDESEFFDTVQSESMLPITSEDQLMDTSSHAAIMRVIDEFCPCIITMFGKRGKQVPIYCFRGSALKKNTKRPMFRTYEVSQELLGDRHLVEVDEALFSERLSERERNRRKIGLRYAEALMGKASKAKVQQFQRLKTSYDSSFLQRHESIVDKNMSCLKSSFLARALTDRHWAEEWGCITDDEIRFYRADRSKAYFRIGVSSIVRASVLPEEENPLFPGYHFMQVETFGRKTCLMFSLKEHRDEWVVLIKEITKRPLDASTNTHGTSFNNHLIEVDEPSSEFLLTKSTMWECNKRKILNCRSFSFRTPKATDSKVTLALAERALLKAMSLEPKGPNDEDLIEFLNYAAALKEADAHSLNENERIAFFLNVYHVMIMHAFLVLGPPDSSLKWLSYFNSIAYQCSDDIFSLAELEHNIIRAQMNYPSQFLSRFVLPKSNYHFAVTKFDHRINFALNCGSLSVPTNRVPIYRPEKLDRQLDTASRVFLSAAVTVRERGGPRDISVGLPKICQWFALDFGDSGSTSEILQVVEPYLEDKKRELLKRLWNERKQIYDLGIWNVKYMPYIFECRFLTLQDDHIADTTA